MSDDATPPTPNPAGDEAKFTQADLDRLVGERIARERQKYSDHDDYKRKAEQFDELEAAQKSEAEKLNERLAEAEQRSTKAEAEALRLNVAFEKGLTPKQAVRLRGATQEELEADADELMQTFAPAEPERPPVGESKPTEQLKPAGGDPDAGGEDIDYDALARSV